MLDLSDTVVAVATPPGRGGIGCVRISGDEAAAIAGRLTGTTLEPDSRATFVRFKGRDDVDVDHGYAVVFPAARSFTGEPTAELWAHGSPAVLAELVAAAVAAGARAAQPGEFTYRALCNGRLDLPRAEAVRDLIEARTRYQARLAFTQADGALSRRIAPLRERLEEWIARGEAAVEFAEESETHLPPGALAAAISAGLDECRSLLAGFEQGRIARDGASLAMVGLPNVGKSSLFNRLLSVDRAIVTATAGTTRDTLEETLDLDGIPVRVIDTAGLRAVDDEVEREGVRRAERARAEADLTMLVLDGSRPLEPLERQAIEQDTVVVINKSDLPSRIDGEVAGQAVSAKTGAGVDALRNELRRRLVGDAHRDEPVLTNVRHASALESARVSLERARTAAGSGLPDELVLEDLRAARRHLDEITGGLDLDDLYDRIFSTFCIGK